LCLSLLLAACAGGPRAVPGTYSESAEANYARAVEAYNDGVWQEAVRYFTYVRNKFAFSRFAALAQLHIGDSHMAADRHAEAIDAFRQFLRFYPSHPQVRAAMYRIGVASYRQIPEGFWIITPPGHERDQSAVHEAIVSFEQFLQRFPRGRYVPSAAELLDDCRARLAEHELYVADFYLDHDRFQAAEWRAERLLERYGGVGFDARALLLLARAQAGRGATEAARRTARRLADEHPDSEEAAAARALQSLPDAPPSREAPAPATAE
jgi:outer membrane protein assembly factor BamD